MDPAVLRTTTEATLTAVLAVLRRDGWKPDGWGLVPPFCLRRALADVVDRTRAVGERDEANKAARQAIADAIGQPIGLIHYFETRPGRTQVDVEAMLEKAIAGMGG